MGAIARTAVFFEGTIAGKGPSVRWPFAGGNAARRAISAPNVLPSLPADRVASCCDTPCSSVPTSGCTERP